MAWSTRQLADLAGTTVKAVRYYHQLGLLDEPERISNGYKQYQVEHLVRLLHITRLRHLGVPLADMADMERTDGGTDDALRALDGELAARIAQLEQVRSEVAILLQHNAPVDVPAAFAPIAHELTERQRALLMVYSTVLSDDALDEFRERISRPDDAERDFESLPADADDEAVEDLAVRVAEAVVRTREDAPWHPTADSPMGTRAADRTMAEAVAALYNPAQLRVLVRVSELLPTPDAL